mgnify:CR=1 FL=1
MADFNSYIDKIDMNFWRELALKRGSYAFNKKGDYSFIVEIQQKMYGDLSKKDISNTP